MFPLCLTAILAAAPIPKGTTYEGSIALLMTRHEPGVIVLSPSGKELKRVILKDLKGHVMLFRLGRNNTCALIETNEESLQGKNQYTKRVYLIDLDDKEKPKVVIQKDTDFIWVLNRDSTTVYGSESDPKADVKQNEVVPHVHWQLDLKTGKFQSIDLPANHSIVDIAHDDDSLLTMQWPDKKKESETQASIYSIKTWKSTFQTTGNCSPRLISGDGKNIVAHEKYQSDDGKRTLYRMMILNVKTQAKVTYPVPEELGSNGAFTIGTNNRVAVVYSQRGRVQIGPGGVILSPQRIYVLPFDGSTNHLIYEPKNGEVITDCDWR